MFNMKKLYKNDCVWAFTIAMVVSVVTFLPFLGQYLFSDVVTFAKSGDQHQSCFPAFVQTGKLLLNNVFYGCDTTTLNGAGEFFRRPGLPVFYVPYMLAAFLGAIFSKPYFFYVLIYFLNFFVCLYFAVRLIQRFFGANRYVAFLYIGTCMMYLLGAMWYNSFAIVSQIIFPVLYFSLLSVDGYRKRDILLWAFPIVLAFTSGYIVLAVASVIFAYFITLLYIYNFRKDVPLIKSIFNVTAIYIVAGCVSFLYCLSIMLYVKQVVNSSDMTLSMATALDVDVRNFINVFLMSFRPINEREGAYLVFMGIPWLIFLLLAFFGKITFNLSKAQRRFIKCNVIITIFLVVTTWGLETSLSTWFYSLFPIFGAMHLPGRYFILTFSTFYLSLCILIQNINCKEIKREKGYLYLCGILLMFAAIIVVLSLYVNIQWMNAEFFVLEMMISVVIIRYVYLYGWNGRKTLLVWGGMLAIFATSWLNNMNYIGASENVLKTDSIGFNPEDEQSLQEFIGTLDSKYLYRYMCFNNGKVITPYIRQNYPWLNDGKYRIANYLGYDLHSGLPKEYAEHFGWYEVNNVDWEYVANTRGDFIVVDQEIINQYYDKWNILVDWSKSGTLSNGMQLLQLKKFVPSFFNKGIYYQEDTDNSILDNGYLYSPDIKKHDVKTFSTDGSTYYNIKVSLKEDANITLLPYDSRSYKYYLDGVEFMPQRYGMQAHWVIPAGEHECKIIYENTLSVMSNGVFALYYIGVLISVMSYAVYKKKRKYMQNTPGHMETKGD